MKYTCIPVSGGYALTEWIEKPVSKAQTITTYQWMLDDEWELKLASQPSIPTLPEHHEHWKSKLYQVVEEGEVVIVRYCSIRTDGIGDCDYRCNEIVAIPKQQQKEEMKTSIPINIGSLDIPYSLEKFKELGVLNIDVEGEEFVFIRKDKVNEMFVELDKIVSEKYTPKEVKEDLWEEVADIMRELSCSNLAIDNCKAHFRIERI